MGRLRDDRAMDDLGRVVTRKTPLRQLHDRDQFRSRMTLLDGDEVGLEAEVQVDGTHVSEGGES